MRSSAIRSGAMRSGAIVLALVVALASSGARAQDGGVPVDGGGPADGPAAAPRLTPPRLIEAPGVELPEGAEPLPEDASIELAITVAADGTVQDAAIATPLREDVDALVLEAARGMRFEPATRDGAPIPARIRFRYRISVPAPEPPPGTAETTEGEAAEGEAAEGEAAEGEAAEGETAAPGTAEPGTAPALPPVATFGARAVVDRPEPGATTRITLTGAELTTVPGTFGDPLRVVGALPGVLRSPFGLPFFVVRGANFQNTGYLVDGFPVPILFHFGLGPSVIPPGMVERQRFYPGNYPVRYGRFSGGLVIVDTAAPDVDSFMVEASVDLLRVAAVTAVPWRDSNGRGVVSAGFRRSYYELLVPLFVQGLSIQYTDYQLRAQYRWNSGFEASIFVLGSDDTLDQSGAIGGGATSEGSNNFIGINFQRAIGRLTWRLAPESTMTLAGSIGRDGQFFGSNNVGQPSQRFELETYNAALRLDVVLRPLPWLGVNAGFDLAGTVTGIDVTAPAPTGLGEYPRPVFDPQLITLRSSAARGAPGAYAEGILTFDPVEISLGIRADILRYGSVTSVAPDPRLVARWRIIPELTVKAGTGLFTQPPMALQTVATGGNPRLPPERSWQTSAGFELDLPLEIDFELNGYYSHMFDVARFSQRLVPGDDGTLRREFFRGDGEGRAYGLEVFIRRPVAENFYAWISYTLSRSERTNSAGEWVLFNQDQEHTLSVVASYYIEGWRFGGRFALSTGRPDREIRGGVYDADANSYDATFTGAVTRLPTYHQLDLRIDREFTIGSDITGTVYLEVMNVYYAQNSEGVIYQYDFERSVPLPGIPVLGTLGISMRYE